MAAKLRELFKEATGMETSEPPKPKKSFTQLAEEQRLQDMEERKAKVVTKAPESEDDETIVQKFRRKIRGEEFVAPDSDDSDDSDDDDTPVKISIPKKSDEKSKKDRGKNEEAGEDEEDGEDSQKKEDSEKEKTVERAESSETDGEVDAKEYESLIGLDPSELVTASGQPVSKKVAKSIEALKRHLKHFAEKAKRLEKERGEHYDPKLKNEHEALRKAHEELKKKYQDKYFEDTEEWNEQYIQPLKQADAEMTKWIQSHSIGDEQDAAKFFRPLLQGMQEALGKKDEVKYYEYVDAIAEKLKKGASARFVQSAPALWSTFQKKEEALADKEKAREEIKKTSLTFAQQQSSTASNAIDSMFTEFEKTNAPIIEAYKKDPRFKDYIDYDNTVTAKVRDAKESIDIAVRQRKVTPQLVELAFRGALSGIKDKEIAGYVQRISDLTEQIENLEKKLGDKQKLIGKVKPSSRPSSFKSESSKDDEDEDEDMVSIFKKRLGRA